MVSILHNGHKSLKNTQPEQPSTNNSSDNKLQADMTLYRQVDVCWTVQSSRDRYMLAVHLAFVQFTIIYIG